MFKRVSRLNTRLKVVLTSVSVIVLFGGSIAIGAGSTYLGNRTDKNNIEANSQALDKSARERASDIGFTNKKDAQSSVADEPASDDRPETVVEEKKTPFIKTSVPSNELAEGVTQIIKPGIEGIVKVTYRITYRSDNTPVKEEVSRTTVSQPVDQITAVGTAPAPIIPPVETPPIPEDPSVACDINTAECGTPPPSEPDEPECVVDPVTLETFCAPTEE